MNEFTTASEMMSEMKEAYAKAEKLPLGLMPRHIWREQRKTDIGKAIKRYLDAGKFIPTEWVDEWNVFCNMDFILERSDGE